MQEVEPIRKHFGIFQPHCDMRLVDTERRARGSPPAPADAVFLISATVVVIHVVVQAATARCNLAMVKALALQRNSISS